MNKLKVFRVLIAIVFFISTLVLFFDLTHNYLEFIAKPILFMQFIPSIFKFLSGFSILAIGFLIVILLTGLFGRVYCSAVCPFGIMHDVVTLVRKKISYKHKFRYKKEQRVLRYTLLVLTVLTPFLSTMKLLIY
jgi:polyferredoxin